VAFDTRAGVKLFSDVRQMVRLPGDVTITVMGTKGFVPNS